MSLFTALALKVIVGSGVVGLTVTGGLYLGKPELFTPKVTKAKEWHSYKCGVCCADPKLLSKK